MKVALLTTVVPGGRRTGGEVVTQTMVDALTARGHDVTVVAYGRPDQETATAGARIVVAGRRAIETAAASPLTVLRWFLLALRTGLPYSAAKYRSPAYRRAAASAAADADVVVVDHAQLGWVVPHLPADAPVALVAHNVEHLLYAEQATSGSILRRLVYGREQRRTRRLEHDLARRVDQVWTLTAAGRDVYGRLLDPGRVWTLAVPGSTTAPAEHPRTRDVALLGTWTWAANAAGLRWFADEVLPALLPHCHVHIAGAGADWCAGLPGVTYHGRVPDAGAFLAGARVVAIPSIAGRGVQVKTLDALAAGSWVVATSTAVRGLDLDDGVVTVADEPGEFAAAVARLVADDRTLGPCAAALRWSRPRRAAFEETVDRAVGELGASAGHRARH